MRIAGVQIHQLLPSTDKTDKELEYYGHRRPYLYYPKTDQFFWGHPGDYHGDLRNQIGNMHGVRGYSLQSKFGDEIAGVIYEPQNNLDEPRHAIWNAPGGYDPEWDNWMDRLHKITGVPVEHDLNPELYNYEMDAVDSSNDWFG